jgi:hypothetical protein
MREDQAGFGEDLLRAIRVWRAHPQLPLLSIAIWIPASSTDVDASSINTVLVLPVVLFAIGWSGTECSWYAHSFSGQGLGLRAAWRITWAYFGRFFGLGVLLGLGFLALTSVALASGNWEPRLVAVAAAACGGAMTFMIPALAFSTRSPGAGIQMGLDTLGKTWPGSAPYVVFSAIPILIATWPWAAVPAGGLWPGAVFGLVNLAAKGTAASYYLRRVGGERPAEPPPEGHVSRTRDRSTGTHVARDLAGCTMLLVVFLVGVGFTGSYGFQRPTLSEPGHTLAMVAGALALLGSLFLFVRVVVRAVASLFR